MKATGFRRVSAARRNSRFSRWSSGRSVRPAVEAPGGEGPARFLRDRGVDLVICGRIGSASQRSLVDEGIKFFGGVSGRVDQVMASYMDGALEPAADFNDYEELQG